MASQARLIMQAVALAGDAKSNVMSVDQHAIDASGLNVIVRAILWSTGSLMRMLGQSDMHKRSNYLKPFRQNLNLSKILLFR